MKVKTVLDDIKWIGVDKHDEVYGYKEKPVWDKEYKEFIPQDTNRVARLLTGFITNIDNTIGKLYSLEGQDLIEHIEVPGDGEPVIVFNEDGRSERRYSAGVVDKAGKLGCYSYGLTKWTNEGITFGWKHWRLPTAEEREGLRPSEELK